MSRADTDKRIALFAAISIEWKTDVWWGCLSRSMRRCQTGDFRVSEGDANRVTDYTSPPTHPALRL